MSKGEPAVFTNMCMVTDGKGNVLLQNRNDPGWPGLVMPGGHVDPMEPFVDSVVREVREETGLTVLNPKLCGVKQFMTGSGDRYVVFFFKADQYKGELQSSDEGEVMWFPRSELPNDRCVRGFPEMLKVFEDDELSELYYDRQDGWRFL